MTPPDSRRPTSRPDRRADVAAAAALRKRAEQIAFRATQREVWLRMHEGEVRTAALRAVEAIIERRGDPERRVENPDAWVTRAVKNEVNTLLRRKLSNERHAEAIVQRFPGVVPFAAMEASGDREVRRADDPLRGLSLQIIDDEEARAIGRAVRATIAAAPSAEDRALLRELGGVDGDGDVSLRELARRHGAPSEQALANKLRRLIGAPDAAGALTPAARLVGRLREPVAETYISLLERFDDENTVTDPVAAAIGHLEWASRLSERRRARAVVGRARLTWIAKHLPDTRGTANKVLRRLAITGCYYVLEQNDAAHDARDERGLDDDVTVLEAVFSVLRGR